MANSESLELVPPSATRRFTVSHLSETMKKPTAKNLFERIDEGVKGGVARALEEHRRAGNSVFIWRRGRIVRVSATRIKGRGKRTASGE